MAEAVRLAAVSKVFGRGPGAVPVLHHVELQIAAGEFVALLGPSGCGKSTLLRLVAGLDQPTGGEVWLGDRRVTGVDRRCAIMFQEPRLLPWRTVAANVELGQRRAAPGASSLDMLERVGLTGFDGSYPHHLSGGMAQRAALARALVGQPGVLLLDEPFASLDALTRLRMQDLLVEACREPRPTVVMVTHDVDEALRLADRVVLFSDRPARVSATISVPRAGTRGRSGDAALLAPLRADILGHFGLSTPALRDGSSVAIA